ncbi:helix-turn-helix domain-containing protein [bacterium]|nr:helix-turn-helix domain-containing protein [bacterium]
MEYRVCESHGVAVSSFKRWIKQYESKGVAGLARADKRVEWLFLDLV